MCVVFNCAQIKFEELTGSIATHCSLHTSPLMLLQSSPASGHCGGEEDQVAGGLASGDTDERLDIKLNHFEHLEAIMDRERESVSATLCVCVPAAITATQLARPMVM